MAASKTWTGKRYGKWSTPMSEPDEQPHDDKGKKKGWLPARANRIARGGCVFLVIAFGLLLLGIPYPEIFLESLLLFTLGWLYFLARVIPELEWNLSMIASSLIVLGIAVVGFHFIARRLRAGWRFRWTLACTGLGGALFAAAIAVTGIFHQGVWLVKDKNIVYDSSRSIVVTNISNARQLLLGLRVFDEDNDRLPESIYEMYPDYVDLDPDEDLGFWSFVDKHKVPHEWLYFSEAKNLPTGQSSTPSDSSVQHILLASPVDIDGKYVVAFSGGSVAAVKRKQYIELLAAQHEALLREDEDEKQ